MDLNPGSNTSTVLRIKLRQDGTGYPPYDSEQVWGVEVGDHTFRLESIPVFAFGLAVDDIVTAVHHGEPEQLWVDELVIPGGHSTLRIVPLGDETSDEPRSICESFGCHVEPTPIHGMLTVDVPPGSDFQDLIAEMRRGRADGLWDFSIGVTSAEHDPAG